jgi:formylglycine-generating enzyme required for sulfatase activity
VAAYPSLELHEGDGQADHINADTGWRETYPLPATVEDLKAQLMCTGSTWTDAPIGKEQLPANCVNFFVAYAFCIWDGGRLPTEAEWNRAAAGGNEHRVYPWSVPPGSTAITPDHAAFDLADPLPPAVGLKPLGSGRWGHADLAGSLDEWTLDFFIEPYESTQCDDCLVTTGSVFRSIRGGSFDDPEDYLFVSKRLNLNENEPRYYLGFRCVRDLETRPIN